MKKVTAAMKREKRAAEILMGEPLKKLGKTTTQIAASLAKMGIQGNRWDHKSCPLALYLTLEYGQDYEIAIYTQLASFGGVGYALPKAFETFVNKFDAGDYPDLDAGLL